MEFGGNALEGQLLLAVFNGLIDEEVPYLQKVEEKITELENILLEETPRDFPMVLMGLRKAMMRLHTFYVQLLDMAEELQGAAGEILVKEEENAWCVFSNRVSRLHDYTENIRENLLQLHELYQAQIDIQQNEIMTMLTVVTTISCLCRCWQLVRYELRKHSPFKLEVRISHRGASDPCYHWTGASLFQEKKVF